MTHGEMYYTAKELLELSNLYRQIQGTCVGMVPKVQHNHEKNVKLDQAELIDTGSLSRDSAFSVGVWPKYGPKGGSQ